jgi:hypothetical protein
MLAGYLSGRSIKMKALKRVKDWMEWRAVRAKDLIIIGVAFAMLLAVSAFGLYAMAILIAAEISP